MNMPPSPEGSTAALLSAGMVPNSTPNPDQSKKRRRRSATVRRGRFHIRTIENPGGSVSHQVVGMHQGIQIRQQFKTRQEAVNFQQQMEIKAAKAPTEQPRLTWLGDLEITDAEAALTTIRQKFPAETFTLLKAAQFFGDRYWVPTTEHTIPTIKDEYLAGKEKEVRPAQYKTLRGLMNRLAAAFPTRKIHEFDTDVVHAWLVKEIGNAAPKTWNNVRGDVGAFFTWCASGPRKWIAVSPTKDIAAKSVTAHTPEIISASAARDLLAHVETLDGGSFTLVYVLLLLLGVRAGSDGEIARIAADVTEGLGSGEVKFTRDQLYLGPKITKMGIPRWITLPENVRAFLKVYPPVAANFNLTAAFNHAPALRKLFSIPHNALRHTFCSQYTKKFGPGAAAVAAGHTEEMQRKRYLNAGISDEENELFFSIQPTKR